MYRIEEQENETIIVEEPMTDYHTIYSYADYLQWRIKERLELFRGRIYKMAGPNQIHQEISGNVFLSIKLFLRDKKSCKVFSAPFDVRLPVQNKLNDNEITTVVQPDVFVVCDPAKLDGRGCCGAPDLVVEILSPGNSRKEVRLKYELYEEAGVKEYWIIQPVEQTLSIFILGNGNRFGGAKIYAPGDVVASGAVPGLTINVEDIFEN